MKFFNTFVIIKIFALIEEVFFYQIEQVLVAFSSIFNGLSCLLALMSLHHNNIFGEGFHDLGFLVNSFSKIIELVIKIMWVETMNL